MPERNLPTVAEIAAMDLAQLSALDVDTLEAIQADLSERKKTVANEAKILDAVLATILDGDASAAFASEHKDTGTVTFDRDDRKIEAKREKGVNWDQQMLATLWSRIEAAGDSAAVYMTREVEYKIKEAAYKDWPDDVRTEFDPARTVKPGATKFTFKPKEKS